MIHIFNRKELLVTSDIREQSRVRDVLASSQIDYVVRAKDKYGTSVRRAETLGIKPEQTYWYRIFVKKEDYDKALHLIRKK